MTPEEFKQTLAHTFRNAMSATTVWVSFDDSSNRIFNDSSAYGYDAGVDFIETNIDEIYSQILRAARSKRTQLDLQPYKFGNAALQGMAKSLGDMTLLTVVVNRKTISISWGNHL